MTATQPGGAPVTAPTQNTESQTHDSVADQQGKKSEDSSNPGRSWKEVCSGSKALERFQLDPNLYEGKVRVTKEKGQVPVVDFDDSIIKELSSAWHSSIIFRPIGARINYDTMSKKVKEALRIKGSFSLSDLTNGYFLLRLDDKFDFVAILSGGPWAVFGHYLAVKPWELSFDPRTDVISNTPIWVRIHYYEETALHHISSGIGDPVRLDIRTLFAERGKFVRVCMGVDMSQELPTTISRTPLL